MRGSSTGRADTQTESVGWGWRLGAECVTKPPEEARLLDGSQNARHRGAPFRPRGGLTTGPGQTEGSRLCLSRSVGLKGVAGLGLVVIWTAPVLASAWDDG